MTKLELTVIKNDSTIPNACWSLPPNLREVAASLSHARRPHDNARATATMSPPAMAPPSTFTMSVA